MTEAIKNCGSTLFYTRPLKHGFACNGATDSEYLISSEQLGSAFRQAADTQLSAYAALSEKAVDCLLLSVKVFIYH